MDERRYAAQYKYRYYNTGYSNIGSVSLKVSISAEGVTNLFNARISHDHASDIFGHNSPKL